MTGAADWGAAFAVSLRRLRKQRGLTRDALAALAGVHPTAVGWIENRTGGTTLYTAGRLAEALGADLREMLAPGRDGPGPDPDRVEDLAAAMHEEACGDCCALTASGHYAMARAALRYLGETPAPVTGRPYARGECRQQNPGAPDGQ